MSGSFHDHCILGRQTRFEGIRASPCGPLPSVSLSRCLYSKNVIDDLPRQLGSNQKQRTFFAAGTERWRINLVTDNSELVSNAIADWCSAVSSLIVQKIKNLARTAPPIYRL